MKPCILKSIPAATGITADLSTNGESVYIGFADGFGAMQTRLTRITFENFCSVIASLGKQLASHSQRVRTVWINAKDSQPFGISWIGESGRDGQLTVTLEDCAVEMRCSRTRFEEFLNTAKSFAAEARKRFHNQRENENAD